MGSGGYGKGQEVLHCIQCEELVQYSLALVTKGDNSVCKREIFKNWRTFSRSPEELASNVLWKPREMTDVWKNTIYANTKKNQRNNTDYIENGYPVICTR